MAYWMNLAQCNNYEHSMLVLNEAKARGLKAYRTYKSYVVWIGDDVQCSSFRKWLLTTHGIKGYYVQCAPNARSSHRLESLPPEGTCSRAWFLIYSENAEDRTAVGKYATTRGWKAYLIGTTGMILVRATMPTNGQKFSRWLRRLPANIPDALKPKVIEMSIKHGIDPAFICAVIEQESNWRSDAIEYAKDASGNSIPSDFGIMQMNKLFAKDAAFKTLFPNYFPPGADWMNPLIGIEAGCWQLAKCYRAATPGSTPEVRLLNTYRRYNGGGNGENIDVTLTRAERVMELRKKYVDQLNPAFPIVPLTAYVVETFTGSSTSIYMWR